MAHVLDLNQKIMEIVLAVSFSRESSNQSAAKSNGGHECSCAYTSLTLSPFTLPSWGKADLS